MGQKTDAHHGKDHIPGGADPIPNWPTGGSSSPQFDIKVVADYDTFEAGDGQFIFAIPSDVNGMNLTSAAAYVTTVGISASGVQIRNITQAADMLSTIISIDASEFTSYTAATPPVIDTGNDDVATGDLISVDIDVAGGGQGLGVILGFS